ncbi:MAG: hypothetical protein IPL77_21960 [Flavobacteriales bacterium]|nr:hypothetical protein [Flavobacteriales bacterium]
MNSRAILLSGTLLLSLTNLAQNFDGFNYQAVVRNASGDPLPSQAVGVQVIIVSGILQPHVEVHSVTTDAHGLIKLVIGEGQLQSGPAFSAINWQDNTAWTCCVAVDITGGTNYAVLGCETFKAVPFALRALTSDSGPPTGWSLNGPMLSNTNAGNVGIGTTSPSAKLDVEGSFQLKDGSQGAQRILTSDADGNASWSNLSAESIFGSGNVPGGDISCLQLIYSLALDHTPYTVAVSDDKAYVINHALDRMEVIDVSNPTDPNLIGHVGVGTNTFLPSISGEYAYLVDYFNHDLKVVDISDPANPTTVATTMTSTYPFDIEVSGNYAYVVGNSPTTLQVFDISNPVVPFLLGSVAVTSDNGSLRASGQLVFLLAQNLFEVIDVSDPASPVVSGSLALNDALGQGSTRRERDHCSLSCECGFPPIYGHIECDRCERPIEPCAPGHLGHWERSYWTCPVRRSCVRNGQGL